jgi:class 3 adenylate cyclase
MDAAIRHVLAPFRRTGGRRCIHARRDRHTDARGILSAIRVPTLVLHPKEDKVEPIEEGRYIADHIAGATLIELPGNNHGWVSPDQDRALEEIERFLLQLRREEAEIDRVLATVMFTDIVGSTALATELGGVGWKELLLHHHKVIRGLLLRYRGTEVDTAGDGFFATFDGPARAIRCALAASRSVRDLGMEIRIGVHTGECELIDQKVGGIAVNIGARIAGLAEPGEVLVSSTVKDLVAGSGLVFEGRGTHELRGVPDEWRLYAVVGA